ncbi:MAG TPA: PKD domain-containing protein [Candidatus Saccharimonadales bacterium]|nr:PKD domain-containing protein [Candidatus Saccharimonadales bacterium]
MFKRLARISVAIVACATLYAAAPAYAAAPPAPNPQTGSAGLQGTVPTPAPTTAATITTPRTGQTFTSMPITVGGLCTDGLLVKIFANNVFIGSVMCDKGSYTVQVSLLDGRNDLVARQFDNLDQPGPDSNIVTVTYANNQFATSGIPLLTLSSIYARRGANPGEQLIWPMSINGGTAPYAVSVDWGDGTQPTLYSEPFAGSFDTSHVYKSPGTYVVIVKATDKNGQTAFLQLVGQANGAVTQSGREDNGKSGTQVIVRVIWVPAALLIPLIILAFWLGRRYELSVLRKRLERQQGK